MTNTYQQKQTALTRIFCETLKDGWVESGWVQSGERVHYCLGGADGPNELMSEIWSLEIRSRWAVECHLLKAAWLEGEPG